MDKVAEKEEAVKEGFIVDLFRHNTWATLKLLDACEGLGDEHLGANVSGTYGSVRDTLLHIVGAEVSYVQRVTGELPGEPPRPDEFPSFEVLKQSARWCEGKFIQLALNASPTDIVEQTRRGMTARYRLTGLLTQVINHSTEHRAQVATILTQQGIEPPEMSGWSYMHEMGYLEETPVKG